ncbi:hypothetical protein C8J57DRAFT_1341276 [Mycena rebaudengoi]|nr:hypothetical protein C8J57DRAFT_1341276 [Mycena rebaudengoi]
MNTKEESDKQAKERIWDGNITVWHAWEPDCDACGRAESSLDSQQLLSCAGCLVSKYCSKKCQKEDWKRTHQNQCHLFEANRKLSSVFAKSLGPGTINDPTLTLAEKVSEWNFLNIANHLVIASAALKNDPKFAGTKNVAFLLSLADERAGSKYEHRTFFIDRVLLLSREESNNAVRVAGFVKGSSRNPQKMVERTDTDHFKILVGWCALPGGETSAMQTHVNRGITHFHASFWPLPRHISDADVDTAKPPPGWMEYVERHDMLLSGLKGGQGLIGRINPDGTRVPLFKFGPSGHFRACAPGETDTEGPAEFQKPLVSPTKMVRLLSKHLDVFKNEQQLKVAKNRFDMPGMTVEEAMKKLCPGHCD